MKTFQILALCVLSLSNLCFGQNLIPNGDFENDFSGWTPVESVSISTSIVHSGSKSMLASDAAQNQYSYAYQELNFDYDTHEINFWVYPASATYISTFELIADWQGGTATFITRVAFRENSISFTAVDTSATISNILMQNNWNKVTIQVDRARLTQDFFINDNLHSSLTSSSFPTIEHLLVGDLSITGMYGTVYFDEISITPSPATDISESRAIPFEHGLKQNYPNPFNPSTAISYEITTTGHVLLKIFNTRGQEVATLVNKKQPAGQHSVMWNGINNDGREMPAGPYLYRLSANGVSTTKKMLLLK